MNSLKEEINRFLGVDDDFPSFHIKNMSIYRDPTSIGMAPIDFIDIDDDYVNGAINIYGVDRIISCFLTIEDFYKSVNKEIADKFRNYISLILNKGEPYDKCKTDQHQ